MYRRVDIHSTDIRIINHITPPKPHWDTTVRRVMLLLAALNPQHGLEDNHLSGQIQWRWCLGDDK